MAAPIPTGSGRIFISYRREETAYPAGWLYDRLVDQFGGGQVFKDIDSIVLGDDFVDVITEAVESCDVLLALIGDEWLTVTDADGRRRIDDPEDFVRLELEAALSRTVRVIPILVDGAKMPRAEELPDSLVKLVRRQALELSPSRFEFDTDRLVRVLDQSLTESGRTTARSATIVAGTSGPADRGGLKRPAEVAASTGPVGANDVGTSGWDGRLRRTNVPTIVGVAAAVLAVVVLLALLIGRLGDSSGDDVEVDPAAVVSGDDLELSDLERSVGHRQPQVGDTVTVTFTLTNVGDRDVVLEGTFVAARNEDDDNRDSDFSNVGAELASGESVETRAQIQLDSTGPWHFWPCYELTNGSVCPDEWLQFPITAG